MTIPASLLQALAGVTDELGQPLATEKTIKNLDGCQGQVMPGWNHCYRPEPGGGMHWERLTDQTGNPLYRTVDLSSLFQFAAV